MSQSPTNKLINLAALSLIRLPLPLKPKRLDAAKLIASCYGKALLSCQLDPEEAWWFTEGSLSLASPLMGFAASQSLVCSPDNPLSFLASRLCGVSVPTALVYYGSMSPTLSPQAMRYGDAVTALSPELLDACRARRHQHLAHRPPGGLEGSAARDGDLVIQDKPGKLSVVSPSREGEKARRSARHEALTGFSRELRAPLAAERFPASTATPLVEAGWGAAVALLASADAASSPLYALHSESWQVEVESFAAPSSGLPKQFAHKLATWLSTQESVPGKTSAYLLAPSFPIAAALEASFLAAPAPLASLAADLHSPDVEFGWAPTLSFLEFLSEKSEASLLIDASHFPTVHAFYRTVHHGAPRHHART